MRRAGIEPIQRQPAQEALHELAGIFDHNPAEPKIKQFTNRHRPAPVFHGNDDAVNAVLRIAEGAQVCRKTIMVSFECAFALSIDDFHAGIASGAQSFNNGARPLATAQHIDVFAEYRKTDDLLIGRSPDNEGNREDRGADERNIRANAQFQERNIRALREKKIER